MASARSSAWHLTQELRARISPFTDSRNQAVRLVASAKDFLRAAGGLTRTRRFATAAFNLDCEILGGRTPGLDQLPDSSHDPAHILSPSGNFLGAMRDFRRGRARFFSKTRSAARDLFSGFLRRSHCASSAGLRCGLFARGLLSCHKCSRYLSRAAIKAALTIGKVPLTHH
jgi:hypothetical protein